MSAGRWVWVPEGWQVIPKTWFAETLFRFEESSINQADIDAALAAAPEPPSGWRQRSADDLPWQDGPVLVWYKGKTFIGWPAQPEIWTPLPPPPEVKP